MNAAELSDAVLAIVQDDVFADVVLDYFNLAMDEITGTEGIDLPGLHATATVTTTSTAAEAALPADYHKGLYWVVSEAQKRRIGTRRDDYHNTVPFLTRYPMQDEVGEINDVVIQGGKLLYQPSADDVLRLNYYRTPTPLVESTDTPTELPAHLHRALLVNFALKEIFGTIEGDFEGGSKSAAIYTSLYMRALGQLMAWCAESVPREPKYVRDTSGNW